MRIIDITKKLNSDITIFPGDPPYERKELATFDRYGYRLCKLSFSSHAGTHLDAPSHFIEYGKQAGDVELHKLIGECCVCKDEDHLLSELNRGMKRVILLFPLRPELLKKILNHGLDLIGTYDLSIGDDDMHRSILNLGVALLENLDLGGIVPKRYVICALPLRTDTDGAPARVVLLEDE